jgi:dTDP-glucose 4,6-dehydratase
MAKILVTGGRGFIGTNLTNELRSRGHDVWTRDILQGEDHQHLKADTGVY